MEVTCTCGTKFVAHHPRAKYCSDRCRKRTKRGGAPADVVELPTMAEPERTVGPVEAAALVELAAVDRVSTTLGQQALSAARRLDRAFIDTGSAYASLNRELRETMAAATRGVALQTSPQQLRDELAERRQRHA